MRELYALWRTWHPLADEQPSKTSAAPLVGALKLHTAADIELVLSWAHTAPDHAAAWLRGECEQATKYLDLVSLLRPQKWDRRIELARTWAAEGRPHKDATPALAPMSLLPANHARPRPRTAYQEGLEYLLSTREVQ